MSFGMKPGFLKQKAQRPILSSAQLQTPEVPGTCQVYSETPYIVVAPAVPSFLLIPSKSDPRMVIVHSLKEIQNVSKLPLWRDTWPSPPHDVPFEIKHCGEKGMGMFARRPILAGEVIVQERPVYVLAYNLTGDRHEMQAFLNTSLAGLSLIAQASVLSLHNCEPETADRSQIPGIIRTNAFPISLPHTTERLGGLFPNLCRANHDCAPNAIYSCNKDSFTGVFRALRAIATGEEISISYASLTVPRAQRQALLSEQYRFTCACRTCSLPTVLAAASDAKREAIADYIAHMDGSTIPEGTSLVRMKQLLSWAEEEGLVEAAWELCQPGLAIARKEGNNDEIVRFAFSLMKYNQALAGDWGLGQEVAQMGISSAEMQALLDNEQFARGFATFYGIMTG